MNLLIQFIEEGYTVKLVPVVAGVKVLVLYDDRIVVDVTRPRLEDAIHEAWLNCPRLEVIAG